LFLQKWNDDPKAGPLCPKVGDYAIFFATSQAAGKDNTGDYAYLSDDKGKRLYDLHGHPMVDHDLFNVRGYLAGQCEQMMGATTSKAKKDVLQAMYKDKLPFVPDRPGIAEAFQDWGRKQGFAFCTEGK
jgi:hypothetical protein